MALKPVDEAHALQIQAGTFGRNAGHSFEDRIALEINGFRYPMEAIDFGQGHIFRGDPAALCLGYMAIREGIKNISGASAISTGALATSEEGKRWLSINGVKVSRCKSDIVVTLRGLKGERRTIGVSTKQCNNATPTNA